MFRPGFSQCPNGDHQQNMRGALIRLLVVTIFCTTFFTTLLCAEDSDQPARTTTTSAKVEPPAQSSALPQLSQRNPRYRLQDGDTLALEFQFTPQFNETVTVQPDGYVSLREAGDVMARGLTLPEFNQTLVAAYSKILLDPVVTATLKTFVQPYFTVEGEVGKPGKYDLHGETTVTESIAMAGGFRATAKHSQVLLFRKKNAEWVEVHQLNVKKMLKGGNLAEDMYLQPGDMLFVPKNMISKISPLIPINLFHLGFLY